MLVIIQARSSSKRFKNKVLYPIYDTPMISHVVEKLKKSKNKIKIVVSTSLEKTDNRLVNFLKKNKINVYRGSLHNVALRLCSTAKKYKYNYFIRISGDSPLLDYRILDKAIMLKKKYKKAEIVTNVFPRTYPKGQSVEIIKTKLLENNLKNLSDHDKEHVTTYFYKNSEKFNIKNFVNKSKKKYIKLSIDTIKNLTSIKKKIDKKKFINFKL